MHPVRLNFGKVHPQNQKPHTLINFPFFWEKRFPNLEDIFLRKTDLNFGYKHVKKLIIHTKYVIITLAKATNVKSEKNVSADNFYYYKNIVNDLTIKIIHELLFDDFCMI